MADATLPDNLPAGAVIAAISVIMSDGSDFTGDLTAEPAAIVTTAGMNLVLARALTPADGGEDTWEVTATQDGYSASQEIEVEIIPIPIGVEFDPDVASLPDSAPADTLIAAISVVMSDGSDFTGNLEAAPIDMVAIAGSDLVTARALAVSDVGPHLFTVTTTA
jgi:hypothetical protein